MRRQGLQSRITRVFLTQVVLITLATVAGVYGSATVVEKVLVKKALEEEAAHFWRLYENNKNIGLPNTANLLGYLSLDGQNEHLPSVLRTLTTSFGRVEIDTHQPIVHVSQQGNARLYLIFNEQQVSKLSFYFGVVPLTIVLLVLYLLAWIAYRQSHRAISPVVQLAKTVAGFDFKKQSLSDLDLKGAEAQADAEVLTLLNALRTFTHRLHDYIEREKQFSRDASHELRTPLAVIKGTAEFLLKDIDANHPDKKALNRLYRTAIHMEGLAETLLLLARAENQSLPADTIILNDLLKEQVSVLKSLYADKPVEATVLEENLLQVKAPEKVLHILFVNLLRNAFNYTQAGDVQMIIKGNSVTVRDSGVGMAADQLQSAFKPYVRADESTQGYGLGLSIVKRLCEHFQWQIEVSSSQQRGTAVTVRFPEYEIVGRR